MFKWRLGQDEFYKEFLEVTKTICDTVHNKNKDYSGDGTDDAFKNFRVSEMLGLATTEQGMLVRMTDKMIRATNLLKQKNFVEGEKMEDTLLDLAAYSIIMYIYVKHEKEQGLKDEAKED